MIQVTATYSDALTGYGYYVPARLGIHNPIPVNVEVLFIELGRRDHCLPV
ncbi:MAG: hypothetical protein RIQ52_1544, partial [Pseudomonadota bacterium]